MDARLEETQAWMPEWDTWPALQLEPPRYVLVERVRRRSEEADRLALGLPLGLLLAALAAAAVAVIALGRGAVPPDVGRAEGSVVADTGRPLVVVPDVRGLSTAAADRVLVSVGLRPHRRPGPRSATAVSQKPYAGQPAATGSPVTLSLSRSDV